MAISIDTPVPTHLGWMPAGNLQLGDILYTPDSGHATITRLHVYNPGHCYEVEFDDGITFVCDEHTKLQVQDREQRNMVTKAINRKNRKHKFGVRGQYPIKTITEIEENYIRPDKRLEYSVLNSRAVAFPTRDLPVPPYLLAIWLAVKTPKNNLWVNNLPIEKIKRIARNYGYAIVVRKVHSKRPGFDIRPSIKDSFLFAGAEIPNSIPLSYMESSIEQRQEFVEGLIDSQKPWYDSKLNKYVINDMSFSYLKHLQGLLESLGYKTSLMKYKSAKHYRLQFKLHENPRKNRRLIKKITKIPAQECVHIETGTQFVVGEGFIPLC